MCIYILRVPFPSKISDKRATMGAGASAESKLELQQSYAAWQSASAAAAPLPEALRRRPAGPSRRLGGTPKSLTAGLARRLQACRPLAHEFAASASMRDPNKPLVGYEEGRWDPRTRAWQDMERCVNAQAEHADTDCDRAWRARSR